MLFFSGKNYIVTFFKTLFRREGFGYKIMENIVTVLWPAR